MIARRYIHANIDGLIGSAFLAALSATEKMLKVILFNFMTTNNDAIFKVHIDIIIININELWIFILNNINKNKTQYFIYKPKVWVNNGQKKRGPESPRQFF